MLDCNEAESIGNQSPPPPEAFEGPPNGIPTIGFAGLPQVGRSYTLALASAPANAPVVLLTGRSHTKFGSIALPFDLSLLGGGPGCMVWTSPEQSIALTASATGDVTVNAAVPSQLSLVGNTFFQSWLVVDPTAPNNSLGVTASNALALVVGL